MEITEYDQIMNRIGFRRVQADRIDPVTSADLEALELTLGHKLPSGYKTFLLKYGVIGGDENSWRIEDTAIGVFLGVAPRSSYDLPRKMANFSEDLPSHVIPIATGASGSYIVMSLAGNDAGTVYCWAHDTAGDFGDEESTSVLADNFDTFLRAIISEPD